MESGNEREAGSQQVGPSQDGELLPAADTGRDGSGSGVGGGGGDDSSGLRGVSVSGEDSSSGGGGRTGGGGGGAIADDGDEPAGKDLGQWVIKNLRYQLAYHSSSVDWYQTEVEKCRAKIADLEAEIVRYEEAKEWHQHYYQDVQADYAELTSSDEVEE